MSKILLIDNFDSFTFNLYQYLGELAETDVVRNTDIPFEELRSEKYSHIVISPGPGNPTDNKYFGRITELIQEFKDKLPILGICLGHQGLGAAFGGMIVNAQQIMHGKTSSFMHSGEALFVGLPEKITVMRYHSLVVERETFPSELQIDAETEDGSVMAFHHKKLKVYGLQFHPESFRTKTGKMLLANFLKETQ